MATSQAKLTQLVLNQPWTSGKKEIFAQELVNLIQGIQTATNNIISRDDDFHLDKTNLQACLTSLSNFFQERTPTEQKRAIEVLMSRDIEKWSKKITVWFGDSKKIVLSDWDKFSNLARSKPVTKNTDGTTNGQILERELAILQIYGVSIEDILYAMRKK